MIFNKLVLKKIVKSMGDETKSNRTVSANSIIKNHMVWSMGAGFIPVPIADLFAVSAIQLDMVRQMSKLYDLDFKLSEGKAIITSLTGSGLARLGARAIKFIPGVGSILGGITMSALAGASTYAIGEVFKKHFETGGTFLDFDPTRLKKYYNEKFEKGKEMAEELRKKQDPTGNEDGLNGQLEQLMKLSEMREKGLLTDDEFQIMKKKLIES